MIGGLGTAVLHHVQPSQALDALVERVVSMQAKGQRPLIVTSLHQVTSLLRHFEQAGGVDSTSIGFIDCTGEHQVDEPGDNILFVESPSMMEIVLIRLDRLLRRMGDGVGVIVHTLDAFAIHAPRDLVHDFAKNMVHNMRAAGVDVELLCICHDSGNEMAKRMEALVDVTLA